MNTPHDDLAARMYPVMAAQDAEQANSTSMYPVMERQLAQRAADELLAGTDTVPQPNVPAPTGQLHRNPPTAEEIETLRAETLRSPGIAADLADARRFLAAHPEYAAIARDPRTGNDASVIRSLARRYRTESRR